MIKNSCDNIEQFLAQIKNMDLDFTQLKKGIFHSELWELSINNIKIQYGNCRLSAKVQAAVNKDFYAFTFLASSHKQIFNGHLTDNNSLVIMEPNKECKRIAFGNFSFITIYIPKAFIKNRFKKLQTGIYKVLCNTLLQRFKNIIYMIFYSNTSDALLNEYFSEIILDHLEAIIAKTELSCITSYYDKKFIKISDFIKKNYKNNLSVVEIANHFKITDRTLRNIFINQIGISPKQFQKSIQINKFREELVKNTKDSISEIIIQNGMRDHSLVTKDFKAFFQKTPTEYKEKVNYMIKS